MYGDCKKDAKTGELITLDTVLTHEIEFCSQQGLDYLFHLEDQDSLMKQLKSKEGYLKIVPNSTTIEKFLTKDLLKKGVIKGERVYTQLSDHYGVSIKF